MRPAKVQPTAIATAWLFPFFVDEDGFFVGEDGIFVVIGGGVEHRSAVMNNTIITYFLTLSPSNVKGKERKFI